MWLVQHQANLGRLALGRRGQRPRAGTIDAEFFLRLAHGESRLISEERLSNAVPTNVWMARTSRVNSEAAIRYTLRVR